MKQPPKWKVYNGAGEYVAACRFIEDAACLVGTLCHGDLDEDGGTIRWDHRVIVWREGKEDFPAAESYDGVADIAIKRRNDWDAARRARQEREDREFWAGIRRQNQSAK